MRRWLLLGLILAAPVGAAEGLTLERAVAEALERHPLLAAADGRIETARGLVAQAGLRLNPRLYLQVENLRGPWQAPFVYANETDNFVYVQQTLETAGKRVLRTELAGVHRRMAEGARELLRQQIAARVRQAWWVALGADRLRRIHEETVRNFAQVVEYHEARVKEGSMAEADLIRVRLESERFLLAANNAALAAARAGIALEREMGREVIGEATAAGELDGTGPEPAPDSEGAVERRGEMVVARLGVEAARAAHRVQVAQARPNVDVLGGYKHTTGLDTAMVGLQVDLPWANRNQGNIAAAVAEIRVAENSVRAAAAVVRAEVKAAAVEVTLRRRQVTETLGPMRDRAMESSRIAQAAYREGGTDLLRLLDAERLRLDTQLVHVQAQVDYRLAVVSLESAMGMVP